MIEGNVWFRLDCPVYVHLCLCNLYSAIIMIIGCYVILTILSSSLYNLIQLDTLNIACPPMFTNVVCMYLSVMCPFLLDAFFHSLPRFFQCPALSARNAHFFVRRLQRLYRREGDKKLPVQPSVECPPELYYCLGADHNGVGYYFRSTSVGGHLGCPRVT